MTYIGYLVQPQARMFELDGTRQDTSKIVTAANGDNPHLLGRVIGSYSVRGREVTPVLPKEQKHVAKQVTNALDTVEDIVGFWTPTCQFE